MRTHPDPGWLLSHGDAWMRTRVLVDLLDRPAGDPEVTLARQAMIDDPRVRALVAEVAAWPGYALTRHNDAGHPIHKLGHLAELGLRRDDPGMPEAIDRVLAHQSPEGAFQSLVRIGKGFGGTGEDTWGWMLCDAPVLLSSLLAMGQGDDPRVQAAVDHLVNLTDANGWHCVTAPELGGFRGPGRKDDPCPMANLYALKALSHVPGHRESTASRRGAEMLLGHWEKQGERKVYLFGIGTDFRKLKAPFVWYDILHAADVLSRFPFVHADPRFCQMVDAITAQADAGSLYRASSIYMAWKGWEFADKKAPSPWITYCVWRILKRTAR